MYILDSRLSYGLGGFLRNCTLRWVHGTCIYSYPTQCYKKALPLQANSLKANKLFLNLYGSSDGYCIVDLVSFIMFLRLR